MEFQKSDEAPRGGPGLAPPAEAQVWWKYRVGGFGDALSRYGCIQYDARERFGMAGVILNSPGPMWQGSAGGARVGPPRGASDAVEFS